MKVKKETWEEICDFCGKPKTAVCSICGKDLCEIHTLTLTRVRMPEEMRQNVFYTEGHRVVSHFCPDHLSFELTEKYNNSLSETKIGEEE